MDTTSAPGAHRLAIRFVGSGSEYFRIWIVNLLLTLLTLGIYYPFAKVRRLRYFHATTEVGGHALSFHGDPKKMLRGYLLVALLFAAYGLAGRLSPIAGAVAFVILAALWPALWHASLRFRLANTGWRGLRARFTGTRGGAYLAMLPSGLLGLLFVGFGLAVQFAAGAPAASPLFALLPLLLLISFPALLWFMRRYQHGHYAVAGETTRFEVSVLSVYGLCLRGLGLAMLSGIVVAPVVALAFMAVGARGPDAEPGLARPLGSMAAGLVTLILMQASVQSYFVSRMQNQAWNGTRSAHLSFDSRLRYRALALLTARNWALMLLTLGLFYPFAKVATTRLRLESVTLVSSLDPDTLLAAPGGAFDDAAGDAAVDLLGLDIGL